MLESTYQRQLMNKIKMMFPDAWVLRNDPSLNQGIPDLLILFGNGQWAMLEVKVSETARQQPNQEHYVAMFNEMSFAAFIYPQNEEQVLDDLQSTFGAFR